VSSVLDDRTPIGDDNNDDDDEDGVVCDEGNDKIPFNGVAFGF
jgi:hypothetical protein